MKHFKKIFTFIFVLFSLIISSGSCGNKNSIDIDSIEVTLNKTELTLEIGKEEILIATVLPKNLDNKVVAWSSNNESVAIVNNLGKVTAIAKGNATITVKTELGNKTSTCIVTVNEEAAIGIEDKKPVDGTAILFDEGMSYYNINPTIFYEDDTNAYIYYTVNKTPDNGVDDVIAVRHATKNNGLWTYGDKKIVLSNSESDWDSKRVSNPSVVKGEFKFNTDTYSYLMAYQGNNNEKEENYSIGLAAAKSPEGPFVRIGNEATVAYDSASYGVFWGIGQPCLVSYDEKGCVYLFYTMGDPISTQTYVLSLDCSDLTKIDGLDNPSSVATKGLLEPNSYTTFNDADFAIDVTNNYLYCVRNYNPPSATDPKLCTAVQVAKMPLNQLHSVNAEWEVIEERINQLDLFEDSNTGWKRVYSGAFLTNEFGQLSDSSKLTLVLSVTSWDEATAQYLYYQTMTMYTFEAA